MIALGIILLIAALFLSSYKGGVYDKPDSLIDVDSGYVPPATPPATEEPAEEPAPVYAPVVEEPPVSSSFIDPVTKRRVI